MKLIKFLLVFCYVSISYSHESFIGEWESFDDKEFPITYSYMNIKTDGSVIIGIMKDGLPRINEVSANLVSVEGGKIVITSVDNEAIKAEYILSPMKINNQKVLLGVHYFYSKDRSGGLRLNAAKTLAFQYMRSNSFILEIDRLHKEISEIKK